MLDLKQITLATEEDKACGLDKWAALFKATTWKEVKKLAADNQIFHDIAQKVYESNSDEQIRWECEAREIHAILEKRAKMQLQHLTDELASKEKLLASTEEQLASKEEQLASKDEQLASKDEQLASKDETIAALQAELARLQSENK